MKTMVYQRKNNDNTVLDFKSGNQPKIISNCSFADYAKAGLAIAGSVGILALVQKTGFIKLF